MATYGYDGIEGYQYNQFDQYNQQGVADSTQYSNPYPNNQYSGYSQISNATVSRSPAVGFNYNRNKKPSGPMVLQEDIDAGADGGAVKSPMLSLDHSTKAQKRPFSGGAGGGFNSPKMSRGGVGGRGGRGSRGGSTFSAGGRGGRGGSTPGRGRGASSRGGFGRPAATPTPTVKSVAGRHPAQAVVDICPNSTFTTVACNKYSGLSNRWIVTLLTPSHGNQMFVGAGMNEKIAKHEAAYAALKQINPLGFLAIVDHLNDTTREQILALREFRNSPVEKRALPNTTNEMDIVRYANKLYSPHADFVMEDPVQVEGSKAPRTLFKATLKVGDMVFEEVGLSKKKAKELVANTCIKCFEFKQPKFLRVDQNNEAEGEEGLEITSEPQSAKLEDKIMIKVYNTLTEKTKGVSKDMISVTNVAGILLQQGTGQSVEDFEVVAVAAGSGNADAKSLKRDGSVVHDWNAEILAIRAFRVYIFDQLDKVIDKKESVLEKAGPSKYRLQSKFKVLMLKNNPPAGDAQVVEGNMKPHLVKQLLAQQGNPGQLQFSSGQRYLTDAHITEKGFKKHHIACASDKLAVCNIAGLLGALLSQFVQPIYIDKYLLHKFPTTSVAAMQRALYERIEAQIYKVPVPYKINKPQIELYASRAARVSFNDKYNLNGGWSISTGDWEVIKGPEGMSISEINLSSPMRRSCANDVEYYEKKLANAKKIQASMRASALSKSAMFGLYTKICRKLGKDIPQTYFACKALADEYHSVKLSINNAFTKAKLGTWPTKAENTEMFKVDEIVNLVKG